MERAPADRALSGVRGVLFDLDGTLIDSVDLIVSSFRHATREVLGETLPDEAILRNVGMPLRAQMDQIAPERADELLASYRQHNAAHHDEQVREYPGTLETVRDLKSRGYMVGVVTSKSAGMMMRGLERCGLADEFDALVSADDVTSHKPHPEPVLEGARRLGLSAGACAYVGDSPHDITAANAAGAVSIAAEWGAFPAAALDAACPDVSLAHIAGLSGVLRGALRGEVVSAAERRV